MTKKEAERQTRQADTLRALGFTSTEATALRRISLTLQQWAEHECNGAIQRDGDYGDGAPYWYNTNTGRELYRAPDRERGALKRLKGIMHARHARHDVDGQPPAPVTFFVQGDPRGAALYILRPGDVPEGQDPGAYYNRGICVY